MRSSAVIASLLAARFVLRAIIWLVFLAMSWAAVARAQDGGASTIHGTPVNGPDSVTRCATLHDGGQSLCYRFDNGDATASRKALKTAPLAEHWQKASQAAAAALVKAQGQAAAANDLAKKHADRADEATKAADASKQRADSLQKAMSGRWFWTLLKVALPSAGALAAGYLLGRYVR